MHDNEFFSVTQIRPFRLLLICLLLFVIVQSFTRAQASAQGDNQVFLPLINSAMAQPGNAPVITSFTASPNVITTGETSTLSWQVSGAATLSLAPGMGPVTGSSVNVNPAATTKYTLTAANANGSASADVWVTVQEPQAGPDGFFLPGIPDIEAPTSHPTVAVDSAGGTHISFAPESNSPTNPVRAAYYAYCPANCTTANAFTLTKLRQNVIFANLALDPAGQPRLLLTTAPSANVYAYEYGTCDTNCTSPSQWRFTTLTHFIPPASAWGVQFGQIFVVDSQGRPRFVYQDWGDSSPGAHVGNFYGYCNVNCHDLANWTEAHLGTDLFARVFALTLSPGGQPRLLWTSYDQDNALTYLFYLECGANCGNGANWRGVRLLDTVSASVEEFASYSLVTDSAGGPRIAYYTGTGEEGTLPANVLYYLSCSAADCTQPQNWFVLDLNFPYMHGEEGVSLALDNQDRPRLAYHAPLTAGFGLQYAWCNSNCATSAAGWHTQEIEPSEEVDQELPIPTEGPCPFPTCNPPEPACTLSFWDTGVRPSLALDPAGKPRVAFDATHHQGGACYSHSDTRLTRFISFLQP